MIKKGILIIVILGFGMFSIAQTNIREITKEIVSNNLSIQALALENQMKRFENREELIPDDPEIGYSYLWGSPSFVGNRTDLNANQRLKFPTYYAKRKKLNNLFGDLYAKELEVEINQVIFNTLDILIDLASSSERKALLIERLDRLQQIHELANQKFKAGEANRIEVEKASLLVDTYQQDLLLINSEERILHRRLVSLNSDQPITIQEPDYSDFSVLIGSGDSGDALSGNPAIEAAEINSRVAEADIELARTGFLPDIIVGYSSEAIKGEKLGGVEMGISIPIWGKPNQVNKAKLKKELFDKRLGLTSQIIQNDWDNLDEMARQSLEIRNNLEASLASMKTKELLEKSWQIGEISLLDYLKELPFYYGVEDRVVEAENQYYKSLLNKNKYHLGGMLRR